MNLCKLGQADKQAACRYGLKQQRAGAPGLTIRAKARQIQSYVNVPTTVDEILNLRNATSQLGDFQRIWSCSGPDLPAERLPESVSVA